MHKFKFLDVDGQSLRLRGPAINWWLFLYLNIDMILTLYDKSKVTISFVSLSIHSFVENEIFTMDQHLSCKRGKEGTM